MIAFSPPAFHPIGPSLRGALLAQPAGPPVVTPGEVKTAGAAFGLATAAIGAATAWVGIHTGQKESGLLSVAGWIVGIAGGLAGAGALLGVVRLLAVPSEEIRRVVEDAQRKAAGVAPPPGAPAAPAAPAPSSRTFEV